MIEQAAYTVEDAALLYVLRANGIANPMGKRDKHGRWYPDDDEKRDCCRVYPPSRRYKHTILRHCYTIKHIAALLDVDYDALRNEARQPYWHVVAKLVNEPLVDAARLSRGARPRMRDYAPALVEQAVKYAHILTDNDIVVFINWIRKHCSEVDTIDWAAIRAVNALQRSE